jgi:hypothetical protein
VRISRETEPCLVAIVASKLEVEMVIALLDVLAEDVAKEAKYCCHSAETEFGSS